ncbi:hypothetical protein EDB81DRAFT_396207 [Dactylonectria macrodidyma]|uniref:Zn(2)-C6 fungal-type domain-containing protein n=1 Tax=Dactylonectria macrodidyma TaxID=307937 RepID=A0A9P9FB53_9HYPO|nr:hypothetical protein EDB81DRAFT_396207 [Dactylonectria macrodidyma]
MASLSSVSSPAPSAAGRCSPTVSQAPLFPSSASPASRSSSTREPSRATRTRTGCRMCREKKVKCDEAQPRCQRCVRLGRECDYTQLLRKKYTRRTTARTTTSDVSELAQDDNGPTELSQTSSADPGAYPPWPHGSGGDSRNVEGRAMSGLDLSDSHPGQDAPTLSDLGTTVDVSPECASILSPFDYLAIQCFRSVLPEEGDTKDPEYSGPSMVWMLARKSPVVLHMVCAVGGQKWCEQNASSREACARKMEAIEHYGAGLRLLVTVTETTNDTTHLDSILATLWLMILYELKFGDGCGVNTHLQGVASMIQGRLYPIQSEFDLAELSADGAEEDVYLQLSPTAENERLSPVSCKIIVWMALLDGGAVINGFGGAFNHLLEQVIPGISKNPARSRLKCLRALQRRSSLVNHQVWGPSYPQHHLIDDMQNIQTACFYAEAGQLRFLLGKLAATEYLIGSPDQDGRKSVAHETRLVGARYYELIHMANQLKLPDPKSQRQFVVMLRFIVPFYHAVVLCFLRIINGPAPLTLKQREALKQIMSLAFKILRDQGQKATTRIAWPLFVAALESDDIVHRTWILERYDQLMHRGENYRRARQALHIAFKEQGLDEREIAYSDLFRRDDVELFII